VKEAGVRPDEKDIRIADLIVAIQQAISMIEENYASDAAKVLRDALDALKPV
jgi:hypothetical protein